MKKRLTNCPLSPGRDAGSVMAVVLMIMVLLTMGGMSALYLSAAESYIVRNSALYRQNRQLAETAAMEGVREILNETNPDRLKPGARDWIWHLSDWNKASADGIPNRKYAVPKAVSENGISTLDQRRETGADTLRYYVAGWKTLPGSSMDIGQGISYKEGRVIGVYDSPRYGRAWVEIGVQKKF